MRHVCGPVRIPPSSVLSLLPFAAVCAAGLVACSAAPSTDVAGVAAAPLVSATTTYLLPVDDQAREACRSTWTEAFCTAGEAQSAGDACVAALLASGSAPPCAATAAGCFELLTAQIPCDAVAPIYPAPSRCSDPVPRTCAFYADCLEARMPCGPGGYALGYGEKYCSRYDVDHHLSPEGLAWRDSVLHCLQESLVPVLAGAATMTCDALTTFAFDSHPRCYTEGPSICFLPPSDVADVIGTIDGKDLLSLRSAKQIGTVAATCIEQIGAALLGLDVPGVDARATPAAGERATLEERLVYWQGLRVAPAAALTGTSP
jgi:hypothetical protein